MLKEPKYYRTSHIGFATLMETYKIGWVGPGHQKKRKAGDIYDSQIYKIGSVYR